MSNCLFCELQNSEVLLENDLAYARYDGFPVSKGHLEVMPKRHIKDWWSATKEERDAILELIDKAKEIVDAKYHPDAYNIGMNLGEEAGQSIFHLHVHLIPRYKGDVENPRGGVRGVIPNKQNY